MEVRKRRTRVLIVAAGLFAAIALAFTLAPRRSIVTGIHIDAAPASVWAVLTNTGAYPAWNPDMMLKGALVPGNVIEHDEGGMVFHPVIVAASPARELAWLGHIGPPRFFDALHWFRMASEDGGTWFTQGEDLRGVLLWVFDAGQLVPGFQAMNARLKTRVEHDK